MGYFPGSQFDEPCGGTCPSCRSLQAAERESHERLLRSFCLREFGAALWNLFAPLTGEEPVQPFAFFEFWFWDTATGLDAYARGEYDKEPWPLFGVKRPELRFEIPYGLKWPEVVRWETVGKAVRIASPSTPEGAP